MGVHFRRQHPVFGYIPDFIALKEQLIIEIDGGYHLRGSNQTLMPNALNGSIKLGISSYVLPMKRCYAILTMCLNKSQIL